MCAVMEHYNSIAARKAENRLAKLIELLFANDRADDAKRVASDPQYREQLFIEFEL